MANIFNSVPFSAPKRNKFNLSHNVKFTCEMGELIPILCQDVIPSDRFKVSAQNIVRLAPLLAPIMSEVDIYLHFFFVPDRIIWSEFETFMTGSKNGKKLSEDQIPSKPTINLIGSTTLNTFNTKENSWTVDGRAAIGHGSLIDYLGFQTFKPGSTLGNLSATAEYEIDQMPLRAYYKVWSDFYRDENLVEDVLPDFVSQSGKLIPTKSNQDQVQNFMSLRRRAWKKDYFTSALPFAQKGDDVLIPGSGSSGPLDISFTKPVHTQTSSSSDVFYREGSPGSGYTNNGLSWSSYGSSSRQISINADVTGGSGNSGGRNQIGVSPIPLNLTELNASLNVSSNGTPASEGTIRELRRAFAAQKFLERRAVGGTRYIEQNLAFFGVKSSDARLQRSEFLGGCKNPLVVSQVLQTSSSTDSSPLAQPAGNAVSAGGKYIFDRQFEEYGWILGIMSVMPKADYIQGIPRKFLRRDVYDYYWPQFAHIGEQPIENQELFMNLNNPDDINHGTFGYTPRYAEYRFNNNRVCGDFKDTLKFWTLARDFNSTPNLNNNFVECNPSTRIYAVEDSQFNHVWCEVALNISALRPIPKYGESL